MNFMGAMDPDTLTSQQNKYDLREINLSKYNRCEKIKGLTCADGRTKYKYILREEFA